MLDKLSLCHIILMQVWLYNPIIKSLQTVIRNNLPILYSNPETKNIFPQGIINVTYKRDKSLRELISLSLFPQTQVRR